MRLLDSVRRVVRNIQVRDTAQYWERRHQERAGRLSSVGDAQLDEDANAADYDQKRAELKAVIVRHAPSGGGRRALDAGCGIGEMLGLLGGLGFDVTGIDFSSSAIEQARRRAPQATLLVGSVDSLGESDRFALVLCVDVLFHVVGDGEWRAALAGFARVLAEDGVVVIQEHLVDEADYRGRDGHVHFRRAADYESALGNNGLHVIDRHRYALSSGFGHKDILVVRRTPG